MKELRLIYLLRQAALSSKCPLGTLCSLCILQFKLIVLFFRSSRHVSYLPCFIGFIHVVRGGTGMTRWSHSRLDRARQQRELETWHENDSIHRAVK